MASANTTTPGGHAAVYDALMWPFERAVLGAWRRRLAARARGRVLEVTDARTHNRGVPVRPLIRSSPLILFSRRMTIPFRPVERSASRSTAARRRTWGAAAAGAAAAG